MTVSELIAQLENHGIDRPIDVLYVRENDQVWQYKVVNVSEDQVGVHLIIESTRKLAASGR